MESHFMTGRAQLSITFPFYKFPLAFSANKISIYLIY